MFGLGGSSNKSSSSSQSSSLGYGFDQSSTYLDPTGQQNQNQLINKFNNNFGQFGQAPGLEHNRVQSMAGLRGMGANLGQFGNQNAWGANQGMGMLNQFAQQQNPYLQAQIAGLAQDAGQFYNEQILPGIGNQAQLAGQRGSSRQGIAEALGAQRVGQEFMQSANQLRSNAYGMQQQAATNMAQMGIQGANQAYGQAANAYGQQANYANQFANTGYQGQMLPFQIGASVIGQPQILSQSTGFDYNTSQSTSKSKGSGASMNLGYAPA